MKKLFTIVMVISITFCSFAQAPQKMSYQCVIRNATGILVINQNVGVKISILQGSPLGAVTYAETYSPNPQTNANGLLSIEIGAGIPLTGTFSAINWASGPYFLKTETDPTGGTAYSVTGTSQLLSVPYALFSKTAENGFSGDYNDLTNKPTLFNGTWASLTGKPTTIAGYGITDAFNGTWASLTGKPTFATVATTGSYTDLINRPASAGVAHINPTSYQTWTAGQYQMQTLATLTMNIPAAGWVLLIHTGNTIFFSQGRTIDAGIGTSTGTMLNSTSMGYLDGTATLRYYMPYTVTTLVSVTAGSRTFYALGGGNSTFSSGEVHMNPRSFTGIFFPQ
jgi:hypothetical protein